MRAPTGEPDPRHDRAPGRRAGIVGHGSTTASMSASSVAISSMGTSRTCQRTTSSGAEARLDAAGVVDVDEVAAAGLGLARIATLGVAAVDDDRAASSRARGGRGCGRGPSSPCRWRAGRSSCRGRSWRGPRGRRRWHAAGRRRRARRRRVRSAWPGSGLDVALVVADAVDAGDLLVVAYDRRAR